MKKLMFFSLLALTFIGTSCSEWIDIDLSNNSDDSSSHHHDITPCHSGDSLSLGNIPQVILDHLNTEFPNISIDWAELLYDNGQNLYGIRLANGLEILFDENGVVINSGDDDDEVSISLDSLAPFILDYINSHFSGISISDARIEIEFGTHYFEIHLSNGADLYFDQLGNFLCRDDNGSYDDDHHHHSGDDDHNSGDDNSNSGDDDNNYSSDSLPSAVLNYLSNTYPNLHISDVHREDYCDDIQAIKVELEGNGSQKVEVYFDLDWNLLFVATKISSSDVPAAVLTTLAAEYPGYGFDSDKLYRWEMADGSTQYELRIETSNSKFEVVLSSSGNIVCVDNSSSDDNSNGNGDDNSNGNGDDNSNGNGDDNSNGNGPSLGNMPDTIRNYLQSNFQGLHIQSVEIEDLCDHSYVIDVELEGNGSQKVEVYFSLDWTLLFVSHQINRNELPDAVINNLNAVYPGFSFDDDKLYRWDMADGSTQFELEIETDDDDFELVVAQDGTILCEDD